MPRQRTERLLLGAGAEEAAVGSACEQVRSPVHNTVQLADGRQVALTPEEFATRFGWKNDPERVRLK